ncbi:SRPBCC domain-containing protein [Mesorhizobium sp. B2-9-1]|uniref:SRPBCC domain-containing protein n=1 Tax=Mesorhizobium sp. B2-9-1 TaxID=2589898 RepID=UPI0032B0F1B0
MSTTRLPRSTVATLTVTTPSDREVRITRVFDAPRPMVFDCWTVPELLKGWLHGPDGWRLETCEVDLRGGRVGALCVAASRRPADGHERHLSRDHPAEPDRGQ